MTTTFSRLVTSQYVINTRSLLRKSTLGKKLISLVSKQINHGYENNFQTELVKNIQLGDIVWDIGANVGFYTKQILALVGKEGKVIAVEPSPISAEICREITNDANLIVIESALGSEIGATYFSIDHNNPTSPTNRLSTSQDGLEIKITTGDTLLQDLKEVPNVIKIDVEGYEVEVLKGMTQVLSHPKLRAIFIEVHSRILEENGYVNAIKTISKTLTSNGFIIEWTDFSHIKGLKK